MYKGITSALLAHPNIKLVTAAWRLLSISKTGLIRRLFFSTAQSSEARTDLSKKLVEAKLGLMEVGQQLDECGRQRDKLKAEIHLVQSSLDIANRRLHASKDREEQHKQELKIRNIDARRLRDELDDTRNSLEVALSATSGLEHNPKWDALQHQRLIDNGNEISEK